LESTQIIVPRIATFYLTTEYQLFHKKGDIPALLYELEESPPPALEAETRTTIGGRIQSLCGSWARKPLNERRQRSERPISHG
jgi:hypothetical protein